MNRGFKVLQANGLSLLQDKGRIGVSQYGVSPSGATDYFAYFWSNKLLGNDDGVAVIEITLGALTLEVQIDTCIAVCGADLNFTLNGKKAPLWQTINLKRGDQLSWGKRVSGLRSYLATKGGFLIANKILGSVATNTREKIGGLYGDGEALKVDDIVVAQPARQQATKSLSPKYIPTYKQAIEVNLIPSYQFHLFDDNNKESFLSSTFTVSSKINRVGYCLQGVSLSHKIKLPYSEAMLIGAVQIPPDGNPIIMLNDAPTIGGYPKIGSVYQKDLYKIAQAYSGDKLSFNLLKNENN